MTIDPKHPAPLADTTEVTVPKQQQEKMSRKVELTLTEGLDTLVHEAIGAASVAWEDMTGTGVFNEAMARDIASQVVAYVNENYTPKAAMEQCAICSQMSAVPINYAMDPYEKAHWQCQNCGAKFAGKVHA